jgi:S1-C subfamily serine protease
MFSGLRFILFSHAILALILAVAPYADAGKGKADIFSGISSGLAGISGKKAGSRELLAPVTINGSGSGFILDRHGHAVTLSEVINGSNNIEVILNNDESWPATVVGRDTVTGITVLQIEAPEKTLARIHPVEFNKKEKPVPGERVFAAGRHLDGNALFAAGIVSCPERTIQSSGKIYDSVIQTDLNMLPCMTGGPLFDSGGMVTGMLFSLPDEPAASYITAFAMPASTVKWVAKQIIANGIVERTWLGASFSAITPSIAKTLALPAEYGLMVTGIVPSGPAAQAGIRACSKNIRIGNRTFPINGDLIIAANNRKLRRYADLQKVLRATSPGGTIMFSLYRGKTFRKIKIHTGVIGPDGKGRLK